MASNWFGRGRGAEPPPDDPFAETEEPDDPLVAEPVREVYRAYGREGGRATMLDVRQRPTTRLRELGEILPFAYLLQASYSGGDGGRDVVSMLFTTCVVTIAGERLAGLRQALMRGEVDFVQEFDGERWTAVPGEAVVRSISVSRPGEGAE